MGPIGWECDEEEAELAYGPLKSAMVSDHQSSLPLTIWILHPAQLSGSVMQALEDLGVFWCALTPLQIQ